MTDSHSLAPLSTLTTTVLAAVRPLPSWGLQPDKLGFSGWTHSGPGTDWQMTGCHQHTDMTVSFASAFMFLSLNASPQY